MLSTKQGSHWYHVNAFGIARPGIEPTTSRSRSGCSTTEPAGPVIGDLVNDNENTKIDLILSIRSQDIE